MIFIDTSPNPIHFTRNRVLLEVSSDLSPQSSPSVGVYKITLGASFQLGETIRFKWGNGNEAVDITMTCALMPGSNAFYYTTLLFDTPTNTAIAALPFFKRNYYLDRDWIITQVADELFFTARASGSFYAMQWSTTDGNITLSTVTAASDAVFPSNFSIQADVYIQENYSVANNTPYTRIKSVQHRVSDNYVAQFDLRELLRPYMGTAEPVLGEAPIMCTNINKRWFVKLTEVYGTNPVGNIYTRVPSSPTQFFRAIKGGLNHQDERAGYGYYTDVVEAYFKNEAQFLTWRYARRTVSPNQPEWLYLLHTDNAAEVYVKCKVYYTDGTDLTYTAHAVLSGPFENHIWRYPIGYSQINIAAQDPTKTVKKWDIYLENDQANQITGSITYMLDLPYHNERFFLYENSLGGWDTLRAIGAHKSGVEVNAKEFSTILPYQFSADSFEATGNYNTSYSEIFEASTGALKSKKELLQLKDFLISEHIRIVDPLANTITTLPVVIERDSFDLVEDDNHAYYLNFKYRHAFTQTQHSNLAFI
jgi:hypothetical protein